MHGDGSVSDSLILYWEKKSNVNIINEETDICYKWRNGPAAEFIYTILSCQKDKAHIFKERKIPVNESEWTAY